MEETAFDGLFWECAREVLQYTKSIYNMVCFTDTNALVIGEVYE